MAELSTLARPYAKAAFEIAQQQSLDKWSDMLQTLKTVVTDETMSTALSEPKLSAQDKADLLIEVAGKDYNDEGKNFIRLLAENQKLSIVSEVSEQFEAYKYEAEGSLQADVLTAMPIDDARQQKLVDALTKRFNKTVTLNIVQQEDLIGGAIIRAGDLVIDGSVTGRLAQLEQTLN
jgi:F-type H+-transporting ATPase subunit delta